VRRIIFLKVTHFNIINLKIRGVFTKLPIQIKSSVTKLTILPDYAYSVNN